MKLDVRSDSPSNGVDLASLLVGPHGGAELEERQLQWPCCFRRAGFEYREDAPIE